MSGIMSSKNAAEVWKWRHTVNMFGRLFVLVFTRENIPRQVLSREEREHDRVCKKVNSGTHIPALPLPCEYSNGIAEVGLQPRMFGVKIYSKNLLQHVDLLQLL